jgi:signal transduction histidine kinase
MRLSLKVGAITALGVCILLLFYGVLRVHRESAAFELDMRRDHHTLGITLAATAKAAADRVGTEQALALLEDVNMIRSDIAIGFVPDSSAANAKPRTGVVTDSLAESRKDHPERMLVSRFPTSLGTTGYLVLRESMQDEDAYVSETKTRVATMTLVIMAISAGMIFGLGYWLVGRPMRLLADKAQRIGDGDLEQPLVLEQRDEIGELAQEINAMCERLAQARAEVKEAAENRVRALEQLRHAERLITVGTLAAGIAHELGTPLNVVLARAKMVAEGESEGEAARRDGRIIGEQVERITRIIQSLLDFARRRPPRVTECDLTALCSSSAELITTLARKQNVRVEVLGTESPLVARVDPGQIQQVLTNLLMNAVQAQPRGGVVRLSVQQVGEPPAGKQLASSGPFYVLRVQDEGPGMTPEAQRQAFEPFFTTKDVGQGTGLGLSVVHGIVEEHGGAVVIDSELGRGTSVSVCLPSRSESAAS